MPSYARKPIVVKAVQWFKAGDHPAVTEWSDTLGFMDTNAFGRVIVSPGDWIVTEPDGEFGLCKLDVFGETHDRVIKTEADYEEALREIEDLVVLDPMPDSKDGNKLESLSILVEAYEADYSMWITKDWKGKADG